MQNRQSETKTETKTTLSPYQAERAVTQAAPVHWSARSGNVLLQLQPGYGNRYVQQRMLERRQLNSGKLQFGHYFIQTKLISRPPGRSYEQKADSVQCHPDGDGPAVAQGIDLNVPFIRQEFWFDCWFAALRMLVKFRWGNEAEPVGHPKAALEGMLRESEREQVRAQNLDVTERHRQLKNLPPRGIKSEELVELACFNGLVALRLPARDKGGFTLDLLYSLLRIHGPLWCAIGYGHVVVVKGVAGGKVIVHDPMGTQNVPYDINAFNELLTLGKDSVMFLPSIPKPEALEAP